jgi:hypothetical protein
MVEPGSFPSSLGHPYYPLSIAGVLRVQSVPNCRGIHPIQAKDSLQVLVALFEFGKLSCSYRFFVLFPGLYTKDPFLALSLALCLLSLGGLPPLAGFFGKLYLFWCGWQAD